MESRWLLGEGRCGSWKVSCTQYKSPPPGVGTEQTVTCGLLEDKNGQNLSDMGAGVKDLEDLWGGMGVYYLKFSKNKNTFYKV